MTRWSSRQLTKTGGARPPFTHFNRTGGPSSAMARHEQRVHDEQALATYVQLEPGVLVIWEGEPYRVMEVSERPLDLWGERFERSFERAVAYWDRYPYGDRPERATWEGRPYAFVLAHDRRPKEKPLHLIGPYNHTWEVLPEHYCICSACGELPPCRHEIAEQEADRSAAQARVLMDIPPGHCLGCGEIITRRQKSVSFPGPNLWRLDLPEGSAVFHARRECAGEVYRYRQQMEEQGGNDSAQAQLSFDDTDT